MVFKIIERDIDNVEEIDEYNKDYELNGELLNQEYAPPEKHWVTKQAEIHLRSSDICSVELLPEFPDWDDYIPNSACLIVTEFGFKFCAYVDDSVRKILKMIETDDDEI